MLTRLTPMATLVVKLKTAGKTKLVCVTEESKRDHK